MESHVFNTGIHIKVTVEFARACYNVNMEWLESLMNSFAAKCDIFFVIFSSLFYIKRKGRRVDPLLSDFNILRFEITESKPFFFSSLPSSHPVFYWVPFYPFKIPISNLKFLSRKSRYPRGLVFISSSQHSTSLRIILKTLGFTLSTKYHYVSHSRPLMILKVVYKFFFPQYLKKETLNVSVNLGRLKCSSLQIVQSFSHYFLLDISHSKESHKQMDLWNANKNN